MDQQEHDLEQLLARASRLVEEFSRGVEPSPAPLLAELEALRAGLHQELTRVRVRYFLSTLQV